MHSLDESTMEQCGNAELSCEEQELLKLYHQSFNDELVDLDLIMDLLQNICSTTSDGESQHLTLLFCQIFFQAVYLRTMIEG